MTAARRRSGSVVAPATRAGNANALASRNPIANAKKYRPITYGSSHIQAIAFEKGGRVNARTILTYGQNEDPTSPWSSDQTRLFGAGKWVRFAWTPEEIPQDLVEVIHLGASGTGTAGSRHVGELGVVGVGEPAAGLLLVDVGDQARCGCGQQHAAAEHDEAESCSRSRRGSRPDRASR